MKEIEIGITVSGVYVTVSGTYHPEEPSQMYDNNMEGYPGSSAEFEISSVKLEGIVITDLLSDEVYQLIIEKSIEHHENN